MSQSIFASIFSNFRDPRIPALLSLLGAALDPADPVDPVDPVDPGLLLLYPAVSQYRRFLYLNLCLFNTFY